MLNLKGFLNKINCKIEDECEGKIRLLEQLTLKILIYACLLVTLGVFAIRKWFNKSLYTYIFLHEGF